MIRLDRRKGRSTSLLAATVALLMLQGCHSQWATVAPEVRPNAEKLGHARGAATASLAGIGWATAYQFIPIAWSRRTQKAYDRALASVPGAMALGNVTLRESYYFWVFGWARKVTIEGEGVRQ